MLSAPCALASNSRSLAAIEASAEFSLVKNATGAGQRRYTSYSHMCAPPIFGRQS
jgi:hypothetical protein